MRIWRKSQNIIEFIIPTKIFQNCSYFKYKAFSKKYNLTFSSLLQINQSALLCVACKTNFIHGILWNLFCIPSYMILVLWNIMKVMVLRTSKVETWFHITLYKMYCFWTIAPPNSLFLLLVNVPKMSKDIKNKNKANIWKHIKIGTFCRSQHKSYLAKKTV